MNDFLEAHRQRMIRVNNTLIALAKELKLLDCDVYAPKERVNFLVILRGEKHVILDFGEIPYRWSLYYQINPSTKGGSSIEIMKRNGEESIFSISEILSELRDNPRMIHVNHLRKL